MNKREFLNQSKRLEHLSSKFPHLYECLDFQRFDEATYDSLVLCTDFDNEEVGGRGGSYRLAQTNPLIRSKGIKKIIKLALPPNAISAVKDNYVLLDVLGGDGVLARALPFLLPKLSSVTILTGDISEDMVKGAESYRLPAIRQAAQNLLLKDDSVDGVIIAYGSHHLSNSERVTALEEANRVLKKGGKIVIHDFEKNSNVANWFHQVVDKYSRTGHDFPHFSENIMNNLLQSSKFQDISIQRIQDSFILPVKSTEDFKLVLGRYLYQMYGLEKINDGRKNDDTWKLVYELAKQYFKYDNYELHSLADDFKLEGIVFFEEDNKWFVEMPRIALVATGVKF